MNYRDFNREKYFRVAIDFADNVRMEFIAENSPYPKYLDRILLQQKKPLGTKYSTIALLVVCPPSNFHPNLASNIGRQIIGYWSDTISQEEFHEYWAAAVKVGETLADTLRQQSTFDEQYFDNSITLRVLNPNMPHFGSQFYEKLSSCGVNSLPKSFH